MLYLHHQIELVGTVDLHRFFGENLLKEGTYLRIGAFLFLILESVRFSKIKS